MTFFRNSFRSIYFVIILFFETLINFLIGLDWIVISPFFLLIYFVSTKRFDNQNIIPLVISGGAGKLEDFYKAFICGASAAAASSIFHFTSITPAEIKKYLNDNNIDVRKNYK